VCHQCRDVGCARINEHRDHGHQHQHRSKEGIKEELERRIDAVHPTPDADNQEHRDQARLEEEVEQDQVERHEDAKHQCFKEQECDHVFLDAFVDAPARGDHKWHQECGQHHKQDRNTIDTHFVLQAHQPLTLFHELETGVVGVEPEQDEQRHKERCHGCRHRDPLGVALCGRIVTAQEQRQNGRAQQRDKRGEGKKVAHQLAPPVRDT